MASGKSPPVGLGRSIDFKITEDTVQRPSSEIEEHVAEEDTAENVLTCSVHMFKMEVRQRMCEYEKY